MKKNILILSIFFLLPLMMSFPVSAVNWGAKLNESQLRGLGIQQVDTSSKRAIRNHYNNIINWMKVNNETGNVLQHWQGGPIQGENFPHVSRETYADLLQAIKNYQEYVLQQAARQQVSSPEALKQQRLGAAVESQYAGTAQAFYERGALEFQGEVERFVEADLLAVNIRDILQATKDSGVFQASIPIIHSVDPAVRTRLAGIAGELLVDIFVGYIGKVDAGVAKNALDTIKDTVKLALASLKRDKELKFDEVMDSRPLLREYAGELYIPGDGQPPLAAAAAAAPPPPGVPPAAGAAAAPPPDLAGGAGIPAPPPLMRGIKKSKLAVAPGFFDDIDQAKKALSKDVPDDKYQESLRKLAVFKPGPSFNPGNRESLSYLLSFLKKDDDTVLAGELEKFYGKGNYSSLIKKASSGDGQVQLDEGELRLVRSLYYHLQGKAKGMMARAGVAKAGAANALAKKSSVGSKENLKLFLFEKLAKNYETRESDSKKKKQEKTITPDTMRFFGVNIVRGGYMEYFLKNHFESLSVSSEFSSDLEGEFENPEVLKNMDERFRNRLSALFERFIVDKSLMPSIQTVTTYQELIDFMEKAFNRGLRDDLVELTNLAKRMAFDELVRGKGLPSLQGLNMPSYLPLNFGKNMDLAVTTLYWHFKNDLGAYVMAQLGFASLQEFRNRLKQADLADLKDQIYKHMNDFWDKLFSQGAREEIVEAARQAGPIYIFKDARKFDLYHSLRGIDIVGNEFKGYQEFNTPVRFAEVDTPRKWAVKRIFPLYTNELRKSQTYKEALARGELVFRQPYQLAYGVIKFKEGADGDEKFVNALKEKIPSHFQSLGKAYAVNAARGLFKRKPNEIREQGMSKEMLFDYVDFSIPAFVKKVLQASPLYDRKFQDSLRAELKAGNENPLPPRFTDLEAALITLEVATASPVKDVFARPGAAGGPPPQPPQ